MLAHFLACKRVRVAGQRRMVGSATLRRLTRGKCGIVTVSHAELDLKKPRKLPGDVEKVFVQVDIAVELRGKGVEEQGVCDNTGRVYVKIAPRYFRPTEVDLLIGYATQAKQKLCWVHETKWQALRAEMVAADLFTVAKEQRRNGE